MSEGNQNELAAELGVRLVETLVEFAVEHGGELDAAIAVSALASIMIGTLDGKPPSKVVRLMKEFLEIVVEALVRNGTIPLRGAM